jgi:hypothetical protein
MFFGHWFRRTLQTTEYAKKTPSYRARKLRLEPLEDRSMLTVIADIVFLYDESISGFQDNLKSWLSNLVAGTNGLHAALDNSGIDVRYGLVGYSGSPRSDPHSFVVGDDTSNSVFQRVWSETDHVDDINAAIALLEGNGGDAEDGWDAVEHAIAEYPFRNGAVPVLVHLQRGSARVMNNNNQFLVRDAVLAALESKNVLVNSMTVAQEGVETPIFELSPYVTGGLTDRWVLGVEADVADGVRDGLHDYYFIDTTDGTNATKPTTISNALQITFNGSNTGATGMVGSGKSILFAPGLTDGLGPTTTATGAYRAKSVLFQEVDMSSGTTAVSDGG